MQFTKWQGCGNDFIVLNALDGIHRNYASMAQKLCDRHYGIGADGILAIEPSDKADFRMRVINADGSEAEMCGNGIRCVSRYLYDNKLTVKKEFQMETGAGILVPKIMEEGGKVTGVRVDMGEPRLLAAEIPVTGYGDGKVVDENIEVLGKVYKMTCVSMGNPHAVVFVDAIKSFPIHEVGTHFEHHAAFPKRTNTEFVEVLDRGHVRMRVWERGAAVTLACGTGACATLVASVLTGRTNRKAEVQLDGGTLLIEWAENNHVLMTGPAELVFTGEVEE